MTRRPRYTEEFVVDRVRFHLPWPPSDVDVWLVQRLARMNPDLNDFKLIEAVSDVYRRIFEASLWESTR